MAADVVGIPPNNRRIALAITASNSAEVRVRLKDLVGPGAGDYIRIRPNRSQFKLDYFRYGNLVQETFLFAAPTAASNIAVWETLLMPDDTSFLQRFERMRNSIAQQIVAPVVVAPGTPIVTANKKRLALIISPPASGTFTVSLNSGTTTGGGMIMATTSSPLMLNIWDHGHLVRETFHISHSAGGVNIACWEVLEL